MPEIAEVETIKNDLLISAILGQQIKNVEVHFSSILCKTTKDIISLLLNKSIHDISRKGKYLIFDLHNLFLIMHLKMTGHLFLKDKNYNLEKHDLLLIQLENHQKLIFYDPRRFGKIYLKKDLSILNKLGPDIFSEDFSFNAFFEKLKTKKKKIKTLLLDQTFVAGIGNIYADEILFIAKIKPEKTSYKINKEKAKILFSSIKKVLQKAVKNRGTSLGKSKSNFSSINGDFGNNQNYLLIHTKKQCPICLSKVTKVKVSQRTSYYCKNCQK